MGSGGNNSGSGDECSYLLGCVRLSKTIPVLFITGVVVWSYYAYVVQLCLFTILEPQKQAVYITFFHVFLFFFLWSYYKTIFTPIKTPSEDFYLSETDVCQMNMLGPDETPKSFLEKRARNLPIYTRTANGCVRYCEKCRCIKPDRSHHCGVCQKCVLKMDHHCPWVNNCVGFSNYKFFLLFLFYSVLYCIYVSLTSVEYFVKFWSEIQKFQAGKFNLLFLFFISTMFGISISALLIYHIYLASKNRTTLESFRPSIFYSTGLADKNGFDLGVRENLKQIFGNTWWKALIPIKTSSCDGIYYPMSREQTMALTNATVNSNIYLAASNPNSTDSLLVSKRLIGGIGIGGGVGVGGTMNHSKISLE